MCNNCLQYGHAKKYCRRQEATCGKCSSVGHSRDQCSSEVVKCVHFNEANRAGSSAYGKLQREEALIKIQDEEKVTIMRARHILENNNEYAERPEKLYVTHFECKMKEDKRKFTPWLLEKCMERQLGSKPKAIRTINSTTFTIEVSNNLQSEKMLAVTEINGTSAQISVNTSLNIIKSLVYMTLTLSRED